MNPKEIILSNNKKIRKTFLLFIKPFILLVFLIISNFASYNYFQYLSGDRFHFRAIVSFVFFILFSYLLPVECSKFSHQSALKDIKHAYIFFICISFIFLIVFILKVKLEYFKYGEILGFYIISELYTVMWYPFWICLISLGIGLGIAKINDKTIRNILLSFIFMLVLSLPVYITSLTAGQRVSNGIHPLVLIVWGIAITFGIILGIVVQK